MDIVRRFLYFYSMELSLSQPQTYTITSTQDINLFLAGIGSGKTHIGGLISGYYIENYPQVFGFVGANTHNQLTTSTLYRLREVWRDIFGWIEGVDYVAGKKPPRHFNTQYHNFDSYDSIISFKNGAVLFKGSLDNAKAHDGKEFGWAILDETKDSKEEDVKDIILTRLRKAGMYVHHETSQLVGVAVNADGTENRAFNPLYILTSPAKVLWINEWFKLDDFQTEIQTLIYDKDKFFVKEFDDKSVVISNTFHNEANLPKGFIEKILKNHTKESAKRLIYGNPFVRSGGEFYSAFDRMRQVIPAVIHEQKTVTAFDPNLPIHISFDQNVVPYITMTLYQLRITGNKVIISCFDEICLENPRNKTEKLCIEFIKRYGSQCKHGLFYYGDPSGRKSDTRTNEHDYDIVKRMLKKYLNNNSERIPYAHPPVIKRKDFINNIFEGVYSDEVEFYVADTCKKLIADLEFIKEDKNGKKNKEVVEDKTTGQKYEKLGHTSDSMDYFICEVLHNMFVNFMTLK